ncbi:MAG: hypothetical protein GXO21_03685 [Aquificae bacterium]|nr:hypothetical protein [Aquificota bacterium]
MKKYVFFVLAFFIFSLFVKNVYSASVYFDYYGVKNVYDGQTVSGNSNVSLTIPCEASSFLRNKDYNLDPKVESPLGNKTGITIRYVATDGFIFPQDRIVFKFYNVSLSPSIYKCWLVFHEYQGLDKNNDGVGDESFDLNRNNNPFDLVIVAESINTVSSSKEIVFKVNQRIPSGAILYLACAEENEPILVEKVGYNFDEFDTSYNPVFVLDNLYSNNQLYNKCNPEKIFKKACLTVEGYACCSGEKLPALEVKNPQCFIDMECQFSIGMKPKVSLINTYLTLDNPSCKKSKSGLIKCFGNSFATTFIDENSGDILRTESCTDKKASGGVIYIRQNDAVDDAIILGEKGWKGKLSLKLYDTRNIYACSDVPVNNKPPYKALDFKNKRVFLDNNGKSFGIRSLGDYEDRLLFKKGEKCYLEAKVLSTDNCEENNSTICLKNGIWEDDVYVGINGLYRLNSVQWGLTQELKIIKDTQQVFSIKMDEKADCFQETCCYEANHFNYFLFWKSQGEEVYVPYMLSLNQFRVIVSNNSCWDAEIYARVWDEKGRVVDDVFLGIVKANSVQLLTGKYIFQKAQRIHSELGRNTTPLFSMILSIGAPKRDIEVAAYDNRAGKTKMVPVYDLSVDSWTYRNVEFNIDAF